MSLTNFKFLGRYVLIFNSIRGMGIELTVSFYKKNTTESNSAAINLP